MNSSNAYIISIDQSTQGTKALLFDQTGALLYRKDRSHRQLVNEQGWVSHDPEEIYQNTIAVVKELVQDSGIDKSLVAGFGISNQRETSLAWDRRNGQPEADAIVWQCSRAKHICSKPEISQAAEYIQQKTGIPLSAFYPAAKFAWLLENMEGIREKQRAGNVCFGTIDTWLVFRLTDGRHYQTDYSNASRTQLYDIVNLEWDQEVCRLFGVLPEYLPEVTDSDGYYGETDFEGLFDRKLPIHAVLGDSHGALFGQGCLKKGMAKTTYGTGSSVMMNAGEKPVFSEQGIATSLAWGMGGRVSYVLEGNINYTGAVITWLKDDLQLIHSSGETDQLARMANPEDQTYLVPAFTGLSAPHWKNDVTGILTGMTRTTKKAEIVKAALECIAYQIKDVVEVMKQDSGTPLQELRVDGGPARNTFLMQFQSDILDLEVKVPDAEELSGIGAAYAAGLSLGIYDEQVFTANISRQSFMPQMKEEKRVLKYEGWKKAVNKVIS